MLKDVLDEDVLNLLFLFFPVDGKCDFCKEGLHNACDNWGVDDKGNRVCCCGYKVLANQLLDRTPSRRRGCPTMGDLSFRFITDPIHSLVNTSNT